jgi:hypothetical protein
MSRLKKSKEWKVSKLFGRTTRKRKAASQAYCFAQLPDFLIRVRNVVRLIPSRAEAPSAQSDRFASQ